MRLGEHDIRTNPDCQLRVCAPKVQDRNIKISKKHPQFDKPPFHNDIAILELESPVEINGKYFLLVGTSRGKWPLVVNFSL